jgi:hypothetical protein
LADFLTANFPSIIFFKKNMKKLFSLFVAAAICALSANAQDTSLTSEQKIKKIDEKSIKWQNSSAEEKQKMMEKREKYANASQEEREKMKNEKNEKKEQRQEKYNNASPENKAKMDEHRAMMQNLPSEKKAEVKREMERHRGEMKRITGVDLPQPSQMQKQNQQ